MVGGKVFVHKFCLVVVEPCSCINHVACVHIRFEAIVPGNPEIVAEYQNKLYYLETEEKLQKFMRFACAAVVEKCQSLLQMLFRM